jgi:hypothetical protein
LQIAETVALNGRKMDKNVLSTFTLDTGADRKAGIAAI